MSKETVSWRFLAALTFILVCGVFIAPSPINLERTKSAEPTLLNTALPLVKECSVIGYASPSAKDSRVQYLKVIVTAYSSRPEETDDDPFITASGQFVRQGIIANNLLPFGTMVKLPKLFGDQVFVVQDRMNAQKSNYHIDIWFASTAEAIRFGAKNTIAEVERKI
jgi:3D (Asp-Asp-Asp) domain-containing protein